MADPYRWVRALGWLRVMAGLDGDALMKPCVMCGKDFEEKDLDFLGRCDACFEIWKNLPEDQRPKISGPYSPIYNGKAKYGF